MTGYLQRLASSVLHPGGNIHPVRDSIFSAPKIRAHPPGNEENQENAKLQGVPPETSVPRESTDLVSDTDDPESIRPPLVSVKDSKSISESPKPLAAPRLSSDSSFLLMPPANGQLPAVRSAELVGNKNIAKEPPKLPIDESEAGAERHNPLLAMFASKNPTDNSEAPAVPETSETLTKDEAHDTTPATKISVSKPSSNLTGRISSDTGLKKPRINRSPAASSREPDEIEIHIGRIEVTALQAAAPVAPAKPRRQAPSLDEYLRRRDRRNS